MMEAESSILNVDQERASLSNRFINFVKNAMKSAKVTTAATLPSDTKDDDKRGAIHQEDTHDDNPDILELLKSPKDQSSERDDRFSNLKLLLFPCEEYEYCGRKYQQNDNHTLNEAAKSLEKFVHNGELGDRDRSFDDGDKACVSPGSLIDSGSEDDIESSEDLCSPGQCPACHIEDCKLSFEEYFDFSDDTESDES